MTKKILMIVMVVMLVMMSSISFAWTIGASVAPTAVEGLGGTAASVLGVMQWGGYIIAVGMLIWVGIKYVTSGAGKKAEAKETLIPIVVGAVLIAAAVTIAEAVFGAVAAS